MTEVIAMRMMNAGKLGLTGRVEGSVEKMIAEVKIGRKI